MSEVTRFLLVYDHERGELVADPPRFEGDLAAEEAFDAYEQAERKYASNRERYEVLLVGADSIDAVRTTHARFFRRSQDSLDNMLTSL